MEKNPWKKLSEEKIYDNPWIGVSEHQVINPSGNPGIYGKVHFKKVALGIIPLDLNGYTWLVGQYRYALNEYSWEIPMGGGDLDVDILDSAKRELKEETGLLANHWEKILRIHTSNSVTDEEGFVFIARDLTQSETEFDDTEDLQIKKLPFQEAVDMVMSGEITDSLSIAGILKTEKLLAE
ncbi:MAG: NUDIX hydrolase [Cyclobacteriaceae bacterium]